MKRIISLALAFLVSTLSMGVIYVQAASSVWNGKTSNFIGVTGAGTEEAPYYIYTAEHLAYLASSVTDTQTYEGVYFKLGADIVLNTASASAMYSGSASGRVWTPIGSKAKYSKFQGNFDGNGHTIKGVYTNTADSGLFKHIGPSGVVKNLGVIDSYITGGAVKDVVGGIAAYNDGTIQNCYLNNSIIYSATSGGIVGHNYKTIKNCFNNSQVIGYSKYSSSITYANGGIAGYSTGTIDYSFNKGVITGGYGGHTGGISGDDDGYIEYCYNSGNIVGKVQQIGGIAGSKEKGWIEYCYNEAYVSGDSYVGGIVGYSTKKVYNSYNTGKVAATQYAGGIAGLGYGANNCYSMGSISANNYVGAVMGATSTTCSKCYYLTGSAINGNRIAQNGIGNSTYGAGTADVAGATTGCSSDNLKIQDTFVGFNFETIWKMSSASHYPILRGINSSLSEITNENAKWTVASGDCTVTFNGKEIIVSGTGAMSNEAVDYDPVWKELAEKIIIEDGVTSIGANVFQNCTNVTEVVFGNTLEIIGTNAFKGCNKLTEIVLPASLKEIGDYAFSGCSVLNSVNFSESSLTIGNYAFMECKVLRSIDFSGTNAKIGDYAFKNCYTLVSVDLTSVTEIGGYAFASLPITEIIIPASVEKMQSYAFYNCSSLTKADIYCKQIAIRLFSDCQYLSQVTLAEGVQDIGEAAFKNCAITEISFPKSLLIFSPQAFDGCFLESVSVVEGNEVYFSQDNAVFRVVLEDNELVYACGIEELPEDVKYTAIRSYAFNNCSALKVADIPFGVSIIDEYAFYDCTEITEVSIPATLSVISVAAFNDCTKLETVYYAGSETERQEMFIFENNEPLLNASWEYNCQQTIGDINGDNIANANDLMIMKKVIIDAVIEGSVDETLCDMNSDGVFDVRDLVRLKRILAGIELKI